MASNQVAPTAGRRIEISLVVDLDAQPIRGTVAAHGGVPHPFAGWLGLTAALEGFRRKKRDEEEEEK